MFQLTISVNVKWNEIIDELSACIESRKLIDQTVCVSRVAGDSVFISIGGENKNKRQTIQSLEDNLVKIYLTVVKKKYIEERLSFMRASDMSKLLLVKVL